MATPTRRNFVRLAGALLATAGITLLSKNAGAAAPKKNMFVHQVYFWLKQSGNEADKQKLIEGLQTLIKIKTIKMAHIGQPAGSTRDVVDGSFAVSWLLFFKDKAAQDSYQQDPVHLEFVKNYSALWERVVVYDSIAV